MSRNSKAANLFRKLVSELERAKALAQATDLEVKAYVEWIEPRLPRHHKRRKKKSR